MEKRVEPNHSLDWHEVNMAFNAYHYTSITCGGLENSAVKLENKLGISAIKLLGCLYREFVKIVNFVWEIHDTAIETTEYPSMRNASI